MTTEQQKTESPDALTRLIGWFILGAVIMAGMKAADWLIPNPPRGPISVEAATVRLECKGEQT